MVECPSCGRENPAGSNFCANCGEALTKGGDTTTTIPAVNDESRANAETTAIQQAIQELPAGHAMLIVERGPDVGAKYLLDTDQAVAGRHPSSEIFLDDITVSRHHSTFRRTPEGFTIGDNGSLNGTYVNRVLVEGEVPLRQGDEVQIGKYRMIFVVSEAGTR